MSKIEYDCLIIAFKLFLLQKLEPTQTQDEEKNIIDKNVR